MDLKEYLSKTKLVADGSFGTYYSAKYSSGEIPELASLMHPERVKEIHRQYILSGAELLRTNTFAAYEAVTGDGIDIHALRKTAVELAFSAVREYRQDACAAEFPNAGLKAGRQAKEQKAEKSVDEGSLKQIYVAGDIGPAPYSFSSDENEKNYLSLAEDLLDAGCRLLVFETFPDMEEIYPVIKQIKKEFPEVFITVSFAVNQFGCSSSGGMAANLLNKAFNAPEIDAAGLNCGIGPAHMASVIKGISKRRGKFLSVFPNSGYPKLVRDRIFYSDNKEYFAERLCEMADAGADILGGCCGTSPDFIRALNASVVRDNTKNKGSEAAGFSEKTKGRNEAFFAGCDSSKKLVAVELVPPLDADDAGIIRSANYLKSLGADVVTLPDSPSGRTRVDSILMAKKVAENTGIKVMPHISCRDRNAIAMRSQLMGAFVNGIYNFLMVTGDPVPEMERGHVKSVFNFDSVRLMSMAHDMNSEFFAEAPLVYGGAVNQGRSSLDAEIRRVQKKLEAGAEFFMSQPVFTKEAADRLRTVKKETGARLLCGIMPLVSRKNALFMKNEISGIGIDDSIVGLFEADASKEQGEQTGILIAKRAMEMCGDFADGWYFSFPFNRVYLMEKLVK